MKVFISVDIEGVAGVVHPHQGAPGSPEYRDACRLLTLECNAAIEGALEAGVQEFVVNDSHAQGRNLLADQLHPAAELVSGDPSVLSMCTGLGPGFDAAFFVGYHGSAGTRDAVIDHTYDSRVIAAGYFGCPVALFSGDAAAVSQMHQYVLPLEGVVVKEGVSRYSARSLHPSVARARLREGAKRAIERLENIPPLVHEGKLDLEVDLFHAVMADVCEWIPAVERRGPRTVGYASDDYLEVFKLFLALTTIAGTAVVGPSR
ncbi:MAG: peptidase M55 [Chloroflexi bacterium]|nr:MAG: peptidase M55 [Chloroflexota bacterium]